ncbi:hypothetical protein PHLCEN_2v4046 [Hermanssonia centrifuga]|uniref:Uncharacterized protein n=1 Tax=Hermanssonia centrifuga TaxID=98765 RepID=A0A2R6Q5G1_9APHY|nr:hypothetical protein PHLCEN_2v4046 [Hermanssonia centrifuga]
MDTECGAELETGASLDNGALLTDTTELDLLVDSGLELEEIRLDEDSEVFGVRGTADSDTLEDTEVALGNVLERVVTRDVEGLLEDTETIDAKVLGSSPVWPVKK